MRVYLGPGDTITLTTGSDTQAVSYFDVTQSNIVYENYEHIEFDESDKPEYFKGISDDILIKMSEILHDSNLAQSLEDYVNTIQIGKRRLA